MKKSKYIVIESDGLETLIQFEIVVKHSDIQVLYSPAISAGFITGDQCYGHSESLKLVARPEEDALLLARLREGI